MEPITNNEFLNSVLEAEAWKEISDNESLSMDILDKYADNLDWDEISENRNVIWTLDGINKFTNRLNWSNFSENWSRPHHQRSCPSEVCQPLGLEGNLKSRLLLQRLGTSRKVCGQGRLERGHHKLEYRKAVGIFRPLSTVHPDGKTSGFSSLELDG